VYVSTEYAFIYKKKTACVLLAPKCLAVVVLADPDHVIGLQHV